VIAAVCAPIAGRLLGRVPIRVVLTVGLVFQLGAMVGFSRLDATSGYGDLWPFLVLMGLTVAIIPVATTELVLSSAPPERGSLMSGLQMTAINLGTLLSVAALGSLVASIVASRYLDALDRVGLSGVTEVSSDEAADLAQAIPPVPSDDSSTVADLFEFAGLEAFSSAMSTALLIAVACVLVAIVLVMAEPITSAVRRRLLG
jgi:DHA2 family multidrug resistance protein-like MFS transporter